MAPRCQSGLVREWVVHTPDFPDFLQHHLIRTINKIKTTKRKVIAYHTSMEHYAFLYVTDLPLGRKPVSKSYARSEMDKVSELVLNRRLGPMVKYLRRVKRFEPLGENEMNPLACMIHNPPFESGKSLNWTCTAYDG